MDKYAIQQQALSNAQNGESSANYTAILTGFVGKGIPSAQIIPRVNVFTYNAWAAKGRQVRRGEHGVRVMTWIDKKDGTGKRPIAATVFHVSQTDAIEARGPLSVPQQPQQPQPTPYVAPVPQAPAVRQPSKPSSKDEVW